MPRVHRARWGPLSADCRQGGPVRELPPGRAGEPSAGRQQRATPQPARGCVLRRRLLAPARAHHQCARVPLTAARGRSARSVARTHAGGARAVRRCLAPRPASGAAAAPAPLLLCGAPVVRSACRTERPSGACMGCVQPLDRLYFVVDQVERLYTGPDRRQDRVNVASTHQAMQLPQPAAAGQIPPLPGRRAPPTAPLPYVPARRRAAPCSSVSCAGEARIGGSSASGVPSAQQDGAARALGRGRPI